MPIFHSSFVRLVGLLTLTASFCRAQTAELRLSDALARADRNPSLLAHTYAERAAEGLIEQAALRPPPTIEVEAQGFGGTRGLRGTRGIEATVDFVQPLERGEKRERRVAVANRERETAVRDYAVRRAEILSATAVAFVETVAAQERLALAQEPLQLARDLLAVVNNRVTAGAGSATEIARARTAVAAAQGDVLRAEAELQAARGRLAATWGGFAAEVGRAAGVLRLPATLPSDAELRAKLAQHPRLAWQRAVVAARKASVELERSQAVQNVTVSGGLRFVGEGSDAGFSAGVSVPLPSRNRNQGAVRAARESLAGAEQAVQGVERELQTAFALAWQEAAGAHAAAITLRRDALPVVTESHTLLRRAHAAGESPLTDLLDTQRELAGLRRELLEIEAKFILAHARAEALVDPNLPVTSAFLSLP